MSHYFTFGCGQQHEGKHVKISGTTAGWARKIMVDKYGLSFCGQYDEEFWGSKGNLCSNYPLLEEIKIEGN
jgi:hypothetical protein